MTDYVLAGLIKRRAETVGRINEARHRLDEMLSELDTLDAALRIFKPDIDFDSLPMKRVPPPHVAFRGELARFLLDVLRRASRKLDTNELGMSVMLARRMNTADKQLVQTMSARTGASLLKMKKKGLVESEPVGGPGNLRRWWLADQGRRVAEAGGGRIVTG